MIAHREVSEEVDSIPKEHFTLLLNKLGKIIIMDINITIMTILMEITLILIPMEVTHMDTDTEEEEARKRKTTLLFFTLSSLASVVFTYKLKYKFQYLVT